MEFVDNYAFLEDFEPFNSLNHNLLSDNTEFLYDNTGAIQYIVVKVSFQLNLVFRCDIRYNLNDERDLEKINSFGDMIFRTVLTSINRYRTPNGEREKVRALCNQDNDPRARFNPEISINNRIGSCELRHDPINHTWAIFIDNIILHRFQNREVAEQVFEYVYRDVRRSSDKWSCVIDGLPYPY